MFNGITRTEKKQKRIVLGVYSAKATVLLQMLWRKYSGIFQKILHRKLNNSSATPRIFSLCFPKSKSKNRLNFQNFNYDVYCSRKSSKFTRLPSILVFSIDTAPGLSNFAKSPPRYLDILRWECSFLGKENIDQKDESFA